MLRTESGAGNGWPRLRQRFARWRRRIAGTAAYRFLRFYARSRPANLAAALAFRALVGLFPFSLLILWFIARFGPHLLRPAVVLGLFAEVLPSSSRGEIVAGLESLRSHLRIVGLIGSIGLFWGASVFFNSLEQAFDVIYQTEDRPLWRSLPLDLLLGAVSIALVLLAGLAGTLNPYLRLWPGALSLIRPLAGPVLGMLGLLAAFLLFTGLYLYLPNRRLRPGQTWPGGLLGAVLFQGLGLLFGYYIRYLGLHRFGVFGLFLVLLLWFYFLGEIILLGAIVNAFLFGRGRPVRGT